MGLVGQGGVWAEAMDPGRPKISTQNHVATGEKYRLKVKFGIGLPVNESNRTKYTAAVSALPK